MREWSARVCVCCVCVCAGARVTDTDREGSKCVRERVRDVSQQPADAILPVCVRLAGFSVELTSPQCRHTQNQSNRDTAADVAASQSIFSIKTKPKVDSPN